MDNLLAESLSRKFQIAKEAIIREEYEMIFLQALLSGKLGKKLVFKGGTALRLGYGSPRFSEDLDFSLLGKVKKDEFVWVIQKMVKDLLLVKIKELTDKHYTHFAILQIKEPYLKQPFSIKIEVSKRPIKWKINQDFTSRLLKSDTMPLETIGFVITLERALKDKKRMIRERQKARDYFDLWWLSQKLGEKIKIELNKKEIIKAKAELHQFLPKSARLTIESWEKR